MSESSSSPKQPRMDYDDSSGKEDHLDKYRNRDHDDQSIFLSKHQRKRSEQDDDDGKDDEGKTKTINMDTARREHTLVMRLANKEQELQDCMNQIQEMKHAKTQNTAQLSSMLLDPAINLVFLRMAKEMEEHKEKLKQKQNELSAWKFTPDSQIGKRMMARCRLLLQENADLGKMISSGRTARLEGEIVLHKALVTEMKKNQKELDEFVGELEEDVEGMQGMIFMLQQQLKEAHEQIARLQQENEQLRTLNMPLDIEPGGSCDSSGNTPVHSWAADSGHQSQPDFTVSKLFPSTQSGKTTENGAVFENAAKRTSPISQPSLLALSGRNRVCMTSSDISVAQNSEEVFTSNTFAFKVTPDSGMQTQEEDISMDTSDFSASLSERQMFNSDLHKVNSKTHLNSRTSDENIRSDVIRREANISQADKDSSTQRSGFPKTLSDDNRRTSISTKSSKSCSDISQKPVQALNESSALDRTTHSSGYSKSISTTAEGGQRTRHSDETTELNNSATGRTNNLLESRYEKTSTNIVIKNEIENKYGDNILDENKTKLHDSHSLNITNLDENKTECQLKLGLINGSPILQDQDL